MMASVLPSGVSPAGLVSHYALVRQRLLQPGGASAESVQDLRRLEPVVVDDIDLVEEIEPDDAIAAALAPIEEMPSAAQAIMPGRAWLLGSGGGTLLLALVAARHELLPAQLLSRRKPLHLAAARQHLCWLLYSHCGWSYKRIGLWLGHVDHTSVRHAVLRWEAGDGKVHRFVWTERQRKDFSALATRTGDLAAAVVEFSITLPIALRNPDWPRLCARLGLLEAVKP